MKEDSNIQWFNVDINIHSFYLVNFMNEWFIFSSENGTLYSCGSNRFGQFGLNDWDDRNELEWISSLKEKKIIQIECGINHSCALTGNIISNVEIFMRSKDDGFVYSWGFNHFGQLGHGDTTKI